MDISARGRFHQGLCPITIGDPTPTQNLDAEWNPRDGFESGDILIDELWGVMIPFARDYVSQSTFVIEGEQSGSVLVKLRMNMSFLLGMKTRCSRSDIQDQVSVSPVATCRSSAPRTG